MAPTDGFRLAPHGILRLRRFAPPLRMTIAGLPTVERSSVMDAAFSSVTSLAKAAFGSENSCSTTWSCDG